MPAITFDITDNKLSKLVTSLKEGGHEQQEGETDKQFFKRCIKEFLAQLQFVHDVREANRGVTQDDNLLT